MDLAYSNEKPQFPEPTRGDRNYNIISFVTCLLQVKLSKVNTLVIF